MNNDALNQLTQRGLEYLADEDPALYEMLERETRRQANVLMMVASSSIADPSVLVCQGMAATNVSTEGYPGRRYHAGCEVVDEIERLAVKRARQAFQAQYANVQPHSGTTANQTVMFSLLKPGDTILGLGLKSGGHLSHGSRASASGNVFRAIGYGLDDAGFIDYEQVAQLAQEHKPKLIVCGASAYPRVIDFQRFRHIADEVGAFLLADISHIAGLVVAGEHPSPIDHAHFTTTSTYKQLFGPRGGLILIGKDHDLPAPDGKRTLAQLMQRAVFPYFQGTPNLSGIAAKARAFHRVATPEFKTLAQRIKANARTIARILMDRGYRVITGGTDNHIILFDVLATGVSGVIAEKALEECRIIVNKNSIPGDVKSPLVTSGVRLGTNSLALRGMGPDEMVQCTELLVTLLSAVKPQDNRRYELDSHTRQSVRDGVKSLCRRFPIPRYGV
ncbi:MAG: serine hydroxymethyltransferase [Anaerolineae bacterium]